MKNAMKPCGVFSTNLGVVHPQTLFNAVSYKRTKQGLCLIHVLLVFKHQKSPIVLRLDDVGLTCSMFSLSIRIFRI